MWSCGKQRGGVIKNIRKRNFQNHHQTFWTNILHRHSPNETETDEYTYCYKLAFIYRLDNKVQWKLNKMENSSGSPRIPCWWTFSAIIKKRNLNLRSVAVSHLALKKSLPPLWPKKSDPSSWGWDILQNVLRFDGLVWLSYFVHVLLYISNPLTWINLSFAALKPCCKADRFEYNKPEFEFNLFLALRGS